MSKEKKGHGTPAVIEKKENKTVFKCGKKHSIGKTEKGSENNQEVEDGIKK